jgi:trehalose utilization protein
MCRAVQKGIIPHLPCNNVSELMGLLILKSCELHRSQREYMGTAVILKHRNASRPLRSETMQNNHLP